MKSIQNYKRLKLYCTLHYIGPEHMTKKAEEAQTVKRELTTRMEGQFEFTQENK